MTVHNDMICALHRLHRDKRGVTMTEFGLLAPVMCLLLMGAFDAGHTLYMKSVVEGAIQKAARDTGLEGGSIAANRTTIDTAVRNQILPLNQSAGIVFSRRYFRNFARASAPIWEPFTDTNGDGNCNGGEPYTDENNSGVRDQASGIDGQGGADDAVIYTVTVTYNRMFPLHRFINIPAQQIVKGSTVMSNQPYGEQVAPTVRNCPI